MTTMMTPEVLDILHKLQSIGIQAERLRSPLDPNRVTDAFRRNGCDQRVASVAEYWIGKITEAAENAIFMGFEGVFLDDPRYARRTTITRLARRQEESELEAAHREADQAEADLRVAVGGCFGDENIDSMLADLHEDLETERDEVSMADVLASAAFEAYDRGQTAESFTDRSPTRLAIA